MRIQQILARAGIASRRHSEDLIREGRVTLAGQLITSPGIRIGPDQYPDLRIDGRRLLAPQRSIYILLHKPGGFISSTSDPQGRPTVLDLLPKGLPRLFPVGRLDFHTEGLLLLTNDGPLTHLLLHPRFHVPKVYEVKVQGIPGPSSLRLLCEGIGSEGERMWAIRAEILRRGTKNAWLLMEVSQGKYHQIRRMCESIGHPVLKLKRISFGPIQLGRLPRGRWRLLKPKEVDLLRRLTAASPDLPKKGASSD
jgi:pseudouridine synthase